MAGFSKRQLIKPRSRLYLERWLVGWWVSSRSSLNKPWGLRASLNIASRGCVLAVRSSFLYLALALTSSILFMLQFSALLLANLYYRGRNCPVKRSPTASAFMELTYAIVSLSTVRYCGGVHIVKRHKC